VEQLGGKLTGGINCIDLFHRLEFTEQFVRVQRYIDNNSDELCGWTNVSQRVCEGALHFGWTCNPKDDIFHLPAVQRVMALVALI